MEDPTPSPVGQANPAQPTQSETPTSPPISDVAHPSSVGAQQTSRPVITNNQPIGKDPMMTEHPSSIESRIVNKMPAEKLQQELDAEVTPNAEQGTLHDMVPEKQMFGQVKHAKKKRFARGILLAVGFIFAIASIGYYFLVFLKQ